MSAIIVKFPTRLFVLHTSVVVLKCGISLLSRLFVLAILIEARDSEIGTISRCLTGLGVESRGERIFFGKDSTIGLQVVFGDILPIHPQTDTFVADELYNAYRFFNGLELFLIAIKLVLVDQHGPCFLLSDMLLLYSIMVLNVKKGWDKCPKKESPFTSLTNKKKHLITEPK